VNYASVASVESKVMPGVRLTVRRMSFSRRVELMRRIRELAQRAEFLRAGDDPAERMDGALLRAEIDRTYVAWGVEAIEGLELDGAPATAETLASTAPEGLFREALEAVKGECGLTEEQIKN
jgi:hypothetical protein